MYNNECRLITKCRAIIVNALNKLNSLINTRYSLEHTIVPHVKLDVDLLRTGHAFVQ